MKKLELYHFPECPFCQIVFSALKETGLEENVTLLNIRQDQEARQRLVKNTGRQTVPCLFIDDSPMHESQDIILWLRNYAREIKKSGDI